MPATTCGCLPVPDGVLIVRVWQAPIRLGSSSRRTRSSFESGGWRVGKVRRRPSSSPLVGATLGAVRCTSRESCASVRCGRSTAREHGVRGHRERGWWRKKMLLVPYIRPSYLVLASFCLILVVTNSDLSMHCYQKLPLSSSVPPETLATNCACLIGPVARRDQLLKKVEEVC